MTRSLSGTARWLDDEGLIKAVARGLHERAMSERRTFSRPGEAALYNGDWEAAPESIKWGWYREARHVLGEARPEGDEI